MTTRATLERYAVDRGPALHQRRRTVPSVAVTSTVIYVLSRWLRRALWHPFELACRWLPLVPFRITITEPVHGVRAIRIDNVVSRLITRIGGGYDYSVSYLVSDVLLVDTGFPWAGRPLKKALSQMGVLSRLANVANTHSHEVIRPRPLSRLRFLQDGSSEPLEGHTFEKGRKVNRKESRFINPKHSFTQEGRSYPPETS